MYEHAGQDRIHGVVGDVSREARATAAEALRSQSAKDWRDGASEREFCYLSFWFYRSLLACMRTDLPTRYVCGSPVGVVMLLLRWRFLAATFIFGRRRWESCEWYLLLHVVDFSPRGSYSNSRSIERHSIRSLHVELEAPVVRGAQHNLRGMQILQAISARGTLGTCTLLTVVERYLDVV